MYISYIQCICSFSNIQQPQLVYFHRYVNVLDFKELWRCKFIRFSIFFVYVWNRFVEHIEFNKSYADKHIYIAIWMNRLYEFLKMLPKYRIHLNNWLNIVKSFLNFVKLSPVLLQTQTRYDMHLHVVFPASHFWSTVNNCKINLMQSEVIVLFLPRRY